MYAHHIINFLNKRIAHFKSMPSEIWDEWGENYLKTCETLISSITLADKFHFGHYQKNVVDVLWAALKKFAPIQLFHTFGEFMQLPFQHTWFDWDTGSPTMTQQGVYLERRSKSEFIFIIFGKFNKEWQMLPICFIINPNKEGIDTIRKLSLKEKWKNDEFPQPNDYHDAISGIYLSLLLLNTRNIGTTTHAPNTKLVKKQRQRKATPMFTYKTLVLTPAAGQTKYKNPNKTYRGIVPWHKIKGKFKLYVPERPLFGIPGNHGLIYVPEHTRGRKKLGKTYKDYFIE